MYGLPRTPGTPRRRAFNPNYAPRYNDLVAWYDAGVEAYADDAGTVLATPGDTVALLKDQSAYGRHMRQPTAAGRGGWGVDSGFPAISFFTEPYGMCMQTTEGSTTGMSFAVFRSLASVWTRYGVVIGRVNTSLGSYRFNDQGVWLNWYNPAGRIRKNGIPVASSFGTINQIWLLTIDHLQTGSASAHMLAGECSGNTQYTPMAIGEVLAYGSMLPIEDVVEIEAMLMQKYGISG